MILIACVDDRMGMMFNSRRLSRDRSVCESILEICRGKALYMEAYSRALFGAALPPGIQVTEDVGAIRDGEYFFAENPKAIDETRIDQIILFRWNRSYPADQFFPVDLSKWRLTDTEEFAGNSHERITKEIWERSHD